MPGLDDIAKDGFEKLESFTKDIAGTPRDKLDAYSRELSNKTLNKLDAVEKEISTRTIDVLEQRADTAFAFVLKSFGLEQVKVTAFTPGKQLDAKDSAGAANSFTGQDKGLPNMHTGVEGKAPISVLGTPIFADVKLSVTKKVDYNLGVEDQTEGLHLKWCLVEVEGVNEIVKTKVQGKNGSDKEYITEGDFMITLRGAFVDTFKQTYPKEMVKKLIKLCRQKVPLKVTSEYLLMFDIHELVVENYKFTQEEGKQNKQTFQLNCSSDIPLILKKKRNGNSK